MVLRSWALLIHNIPPKPAYLRNKVANRLAGMGAVALKNSVYVLPESAAAREGLMWVAQEVEAGGGSAFVGRVEFLGDGTAQRIVDGFIAARERDYQPLLATLRTVEAELDGLAGGDAEGVKLAARRAVSGVRKRAVEIRELDFFMAPAGEVVAGKLADLEQRLAKLTQPVVAGDDAPPVLDPAAYRDRVWVTREGVFVDRIASAWLIRRFIDPAARFKLVAEWEYLPRPGEVRFDMPGGEFTHIGERCTFEVLISRFGLAGEGMIKLARIIHDIDLKTPEHAHPETSGIAALLAAIAQNSPADAERLRRGGEVLDHLLSWFSMPPGATR